MKRSGSIKSHWRAALAALAALLAAASLVSVSAADSPADKDAKPATKTKSEKKKLTGAELYAIHCNRCHPERYAPERNADQWKTILLHMRVRANLPAEQSRTILKYLQDNSGR